MPSTAVVEEVPKEKPRAQGAQTDAYECNDESESQGSSEVIVDRISSTVTDLEDMLEADPYFTLSQFRSSIFATVVEDVILALRILGECNNKMKVLMIYHNMAAHLTHKYGVADPAVMPQELDVIDPRRLHCEEYKLSKLEKDRQEIADVMQSTYRSLSLAHSFRPLWVYCDDYVRHKEQLELIKEEAAKNKIVSRTLRKQLRQQRIQHTTAEYEADEVNDTLRKRIQDAEQLAATKERYAQKWQNARIEQHVEVIGLTGGSLTDSIEYYKTRSEHESIVHSEIEALVNISIQENLEKVEDLMAKYEKDIEAMDLTIQISMSDVNKILATNKELTDKIARQDKDIKAWVKFKEERAVAQKYHNDMQRSAATIQAWWRGILVRMKLGPFREAKKAKGKKK